MTRAGCVFLICVCGHIRSSFPLPGRFIVHIFELFRTTRNYKVPPRMGSLLGSIEKMGAASASSGTCLGMEFDSSNMQFGVGGKN